MKNKKILIPLILILLAVIIIGIITYPTKKEPEVIKIGAILPLTGSAASFGQYVKEGLDLALKEINKNEKKFEIIYEDSKGKPQEAVNAYQKLINLENIKIVFAALSSVASAIGPLAEKTKVIQIYVDVVKPEVADGIYKFRFYPEASKTAGFLAEFAYKKLSSKKAAVLRINDDYGEASLSAFKERFENLGGKVIWSEPYEIGQSDFKNLVIKLKSLEEDLDVIYINGYGSSFVNAVKAVRTFIKDINIVADVALGVPENLSQLKEVAEGLYFVDGIMSEEFINIFKDNYGKLPTSDAGYAYAALKIISDIIKRSGTSFESISNGLRSIKNYPSAMGSITMRDNGDADLEFVIMQVKGGIPTLVK